MATVREHERLTSQKPSEQAQSVLGWTTHFESMEPRESQGYSIPGVYPDPNVILHFHFAPRGTSGRVEVGGLFTTVNYLGLVNSLGPEISAALQTAVLPSYGTRRAMAHTITAITFAAQIQQLQNFAQTIKVQLPPTTLHIAVADTLQRTFQTELREVVSLAAEEYARSLGAYGSLILTKKLVWETIPNLRHLSIDRQEDLDEGGYPVIRFTITTPDPVERVLEQDDQLQRAFCHRIPPRHQPYFAITYQSGT